MNDESAVKGQIEVVNEPAGQPEAKDQEQPQRQGPEKVIELSATPRKVHLNELPQCVVEFSLTGLAKLLQLPPDLLLIDARMSERRVEGERVLQVKVAGIGRPPMAGKLPITSLAMSHYEILGWRLSWASAGLVVSYDSKPLPLATWPSDGAEKIIPPQG